MPIIWIRHAPKLHFPESVDSAITSKSGKQIRRLSQILARRYGQIDQVYSSPYLRCRQTAAELNCHFEIDCKLAEQQKYSNSIHSETLSYSPPLDESDLEFRNRVREHLEKLLQSNLNSVTLCVTHGRVVTEIQSILASHQKPRYPRTLSCLILNQNRELEYQGDFSLI